MNVNWKIRLKNKTFLLAMSALAVSLIYQIMALTFNFVPGVSQDMVVELIGIVINILALLGVVVDPTTEGINDSSRAMTYGTDNDVRIQENKEDV